MLYCYPEDIVHAEGFGIVLRTYRDAFLSQKVVKPMAGYVRGMLAKLRNAVAKGPELEVHRIRRDVGKDAMHALRVSRMLHEVLVEGRFDIRRHHDAEELVAIRLAPQDALLHGQRAEDLLAHLPEWKAQTSLPEEPDYRNLDALCVSLIERSFSSPLA